MVRILFFLVGLLGFVGCKEQPNESTYNVEKWGYKECKERLQAGDILLKMGHGKISNLIVKVMQEDLKLSHCAIVVRDSTNEFSVIHSVSGQVAETDGVQQVSLKIFCKDVVPKSLHVLRYKNDEKVIQKIQERAKHYLAKDLPFDHEFDKTDSTALYCSEFVELTLKTATGKSVLETKKIGYNNVYTFTSLLKNSHFEVVNKKKD